MPLFGKDLGLSQRFVGRDEFRTPFISLAANNPLYPVTLFARVYPKLYFYICCPLELLRRW